MLALLADSVFVLHGAFVVLAIPSAFLAYAGFYRRRQLLGRLHNLAITIMVTGRVFLGKCPLVAIEAALRHRAGEKMPYTGGYVAYAFRSLVGIAPPSGSVMAMSAAVAVITAAAIVRQRGQTGESALAPEPVTSP